LREADKRLENTRCIAGKEIPTISARYVLLDDPYVLTAYDSRGLTYERSTSMEWRWFGVEKHQHHLLHDDKVVARYVWYWKNLMPNSFFESFTTCPENARGTYSVESGIQDFWNLVLSPKGVSATDANRPLDK
jgi:hypothetical protein